jgi:hypothetical protein
MIDKFAVTTAHIMIFAVFGKSNEWINPVNFGTLCPAYFIWLFG